MDLCASSYEVDDPDVVSLCDVLMTIMLMIIEVDGDIFPTL